MAGGAIHHIEKLLLSGMCISQMKTPAILLSGIASKGKYRPMNLQRHDTLNFRADPDVRYFEENGDTDTLILNMGPQHPSTHGVLRIVLRLDGEYIVEARPVIGYLHRMHEKMAETRSWVQYIPNMGRVDYLNAMAWNWAYVGAVERLSEIRAPERAEYIRVIASEL